MASVNSRIKQYQKAHLRAYRVSRRHAPGTCYHTRAVNSMRLNERFIKALRADGTINTWLNHEPDTPKADER